MYENIIKRKKLSKAEAEVLTLHLNLDKIGLLLNTKTKDRETYDTILYAFADFIDGKVNDIARWSISRDVYFKTVFGGRAIIVKYISIDTGLPQSIVDMYILSVREEFFDMFLFVLLKHKLVLATEMDIETVKAHGIVKPISLDDYDKITKGELITSPIIKTVDGLYNELTIVPDPKTFWQRLKERLTP